MPEKDKAVDANKIKRPRRLTRISRGISRRFNRVLAAWVMLIAFIIGFPKAFLFLTDGTVAYYAVTNSNGSLAIGRDHEGRLVDSPDAVRVARYSKGGRELGSVIWGQPIRSMLQWDRSVPGMIWGQNIERWCIVTHEGSQGTIDAFKAIGPGRRDVFTWEFALEKELQNPNEDVYRSNRVGNNDISYIALARSGERDLICFTIGGIVLPYGIVVLELTDQGFVEIYRLWHPGAFGSISVVNSVDEQSKTERSQVLVVTGLNSHLIDSAVTSAKPNRPPYRSVLLSINLDKLPEAKVVKPPVPPDYFPWVKKVAQLDDTLYCDHLERIDAWIKRSKFLDYRVIKPARVRFKPGPKVSDTGMFMVDIELPGAPQPPVESNQAKSESNNEKSDSKQEKSDMFGIYALVKNGKLECDPEVLSQHELSDPLTKIKEPDQKPSIVTLSEFLFPSDKSKNEQSNHGETD